jgi:hypothetical protein
VSETKTLLTWAETYVSTKSAKAGGIRLFSYTWASGEAHPGEPWVMRCDLPGFGERRWRSGSEIDLQEKAERILAKWLAKITGGQEPAAGPRLTDGHPHQNGAHPGWLGHDGHRVHRHEMSTGRTEWEKP